MIDDSTIVKAFQRGYELGYLRGSEASQALLKVRREQSMVQAFNELPAGKAGDILARKEDGTHYWKSQDATSSETKLNPEPYLMEKLEKQ